MSQEPQHALNGADQRSAEQLGHPRDLAEDANRGRSGATPLSAGSPSFDREQDRDELAYGDQVPPQHPQAPTQLRQPGPPPHPQAPGPPVGYTYAQRLQRLPPAPRLVPPRGNMQHASPSMTAGSLSAASYEGPDSSSQGSPTLNPGIHMPHGGGPMHHDPPMRHMSPSHGPMPGHLGPLPVPMPGPLHGPRDAPPHGLHGGPPQGMHPSMPQGIHQPLRQGLFPGPGQGPGPLAHGHPQHGPPGGMFGPHSGPPPAQYVPPHVAAPPIPIAPLGSSAGLAAGAVPHPRSQILQIPRTVTAGARIASTNAAIAAIQRSAPPVIQPVPVHRPAMALAGLPQPAGGDLKGTIVYDADSGVKVVDEITAQKAASEFSSFLNRKRTSRKRVWKVYWRNRLDINRKILVTENQCFKEARDDAADLDDSEGEETTRRGRPVVVPYIYHNTGSFDVEPPRPVLMPDPDFILQRTASGSQLVEEHSQLVHHVQRPQFAQTPSLYPAPHPSQPFPPVNPPLHSGLPIHQHGTYPTGVEPISHNSNLPPGPLPPHGMRVPVPQSARQRAASMVRKF